MPPEIKDHTAMSAGNSSGDDRDDDEILFHRRSSYDVNSKIMLTAIISLSAVVILVVILHIYARFVLRRQARRRSAMRRLSEAIAAGRDSGEPPKTGLDPAVIAALPLILYGKSGAGECAVCLSGLEEGDPARLLPNCNHAFHVGCIDTWLRAQSTCPVCRSEARPAPRLEMEGHEPPAPASLSPTAPPMDGAGPISSGCAETTSFEAGGPANSSGSKNLGSSSRLSSLKRMLSWERSSRRHHPPSDALEDGIEDLERQ